MSQNTMNTAITGGILGGFTVPTFGAVVTGAIIAVLIMSIIKNVKSY